MRIAFFSDNAYPELSGIVDSIRITGRELVKRGHEVVFVGPQYPKGAYSLVGNKKDTSLGYESIDGRRIVRLPSLPLPYSPTGQSRLAIPTGATFNHFDEHKPDLVHTHSPYGAGIEALRVAKRYRVPLVGTNHTAVEEFYPFAPELMRRFDAWYYQHCDLVTAPYQELLERMREKGFSKKGVRQANPVMLDLFEPPTPDERAALRKKFELSGPTLIYAGRLAIEKRVDVVLRALPALVKDYPDLTFIVTGRGAEDGKLRALAKQLGIERNVRFTGFLSFEALAGYYKASDFFVLMSTSDSQSLALMQAHATGIPSVGARSKGLPEYIPTDAGFIVEPNDTAALSERMRELIEDPSLRARLGAGAHAFVKQFEPAHIAAQWEALYQSVLP